VHFELDGPALVARRERIVAQLRRAVIHHSRGDLEVAIAGFAEGSSS
jgi:hypothetical protein